MLAQRPGTSIYINQDSRSLRYLTRCVVLGSSLLPNTVQFHLLRKGIETVSIALMLTGILWVEPTLKQASGVNAHAALMSMPTCN